MSRFRTVLFDLDGTLIDHFAAIHRCYSHTLPQVGLPPPTLQQVRDVIGGGLENAIEKLVGSERVPAAIKIYRAFWEQTMLDNVALMPGGRELLEQLRVQGVRCGVFTNKLGTSSRQVCDHLGVTPLLDVIIGAKDTPWLKPQREFSQHVLTLLDANPATTLLIGDSPYDIAAAHNGGFACWCVTTGTHSAAELREAKADAIFSNLTEISAALKQVA